jgi:hypothetical protein
LTWIVVIVDLELQNSKDIYMAAGNEENVTPRS